jgi:hypothetical protein
MVAGGDARPTIFRNLWVGRRPINDCFEKLINRIDLVERPSLAASRAGIEARPTSLLMVYG